MIRYDHRGHGASPVPPAPYAIADLAGDLVALLNRLEVPRAHVCGLSLGGQVAMWLGAHAPERVDRLVLCSTSAWFGPPEPWLERAAMVRSAGASAVADAVVGRWLTPAFAKGHPEVVARLRAMIAATPAEGYAACCEVVGLTDLRADLAAIRAPAPGHRRGAGSGVSALEAERIATGVSGARVALVDAAHLANVERADDVTGLILEHLCSTTGEEEP